MNVPTAQEGSWEAVLHAIEPTDKIIFVDELKSNSAMMQPVGHRAIGVEYNPENEAGNYVSSVIPERYNTFIFIDKTNALHPISTKSSGRQKLQRKNTFSLLD
jgi:erythromycin esterase